MSRSTRTRRGLRIAAAAAVAAVASLAFAAPAQAAELKESHEGARAATFGTQDCSAPFDMLQDGYDGWHFVLPGQSDFESITLFYNAPGGPVTVGPIASPDPDAPTSDPDGRWSGYIDATGSEAFKHAYITTEAGWTLTGGTATTDPDTDEFNLSHTCAGTPTTPTPGASVSPTEVPSGAPETGGGGSQTTTGMTLGVGALALAGAATVGLVVARRRRTVA
jgi:hypothetical protein